VDIPFQQCVAHLIRAKSVNIHCMTVGDLNLGFSACISPNTYSIHVSPDALGLTFIIDGIKSTGQVSN